LSATLHEEVIMRDGRAVPGNFHDYPILRPDEMPDVEVAIIDSGAKIGGAGEIATCPVAPAVCNAVFALTGKRIRRLPIARQA
jgi:isoquinoline 1-oxidoreductase beta subunit